MLPFFFLQDNISLEREIQELTDRLTEAIKVNIDLTKEIEESHIIRRKVCFNLHFLFSLPQLT